MFSYNKTQSDTLKKNYSFRQNNGRICNLYIFRGPINVNISLHNVFNKTPVNNTIHDYLQNTLYNQCFKLNSCS